MKKRSFFAILLLLTSVLVSPDAPIAHAYTDVAANDDYAAAIAWLTEQKVLQGYGDGSFQPDKNINRAEFLKVLMALKASSSVEETIAIPDSPCFSDVSPSAWFAPYICSAQTAGIIQGYSDGSFRPEQVISVVEASKIIALTLELELNPTIQGTEWYAPYLETLGDLNVYPTELNYLTEDVTRGELAEMIWRLKTKNTSEPATAWRDFATECTSFSYDIPENIDLKTIETTWLHWMNDTRAQQGLSPYAYDDQLIRTATIWSQTSKSRGYMDHKRPGTTAYYDYYAIEAWFSDLGLNFANEGGYTFTENIGHGPYSCHVDDCTTDVLEAMRYTYDYYLSEAGSSYSPHWNSIISPRFNHVGVGLTVDGDSYYLTIHYATELTSSAPPLCNSIYE